MFLGTVLCRDSFWANGARACLEGEPEWREPRASVDEESGYSDSEILWGDTNA